jgi:ligand-binding sensor domain-containing protein
LGEVVDRAVAMEAWIPKLNPMPDLVQALVEDDNGALLIAMRGGIDQLIDGKDEAYPRPGTGRQLNPTWLLRDRSGGLWIGTAEHCFWMK